MSVEPARKPRPWWQQATALVTVTTGGVITGLSFAPGTPGTMTSPNGLPVHLLAMQQSAGGALGADGSSLAGGGAQSGDSVLRPAIVNIARHYLHLARTKSPAEMEALIWAADSVDGVDHGQSCAAFASLTLDLAAQAVGQESWVTGGTTYPWPLHSWADVRVDPNPDSLNITSIVQDAQSHARWHPAGDGYTPQPGDWVLFHQHVEVVTGYANGVLHTIGGDSLPNFTVNAHTFTGPLADAGVEGFVDNGHLASAAAKAAPPSTPPASTAPASTPTTSTAPASTAQPSSKPTAKAAPKPAAKPAAAKAAATSGASGLAGGADIPGLPATSTPAPAQPDGRRPAAGQPATAKRAVVKAKPAAVLAAIPGVSAAGPGPAAPAATGHPTPGQPTPGQPSIPGVQGFAAPVAGATPRAAPAHAAPAHAAPAHPAPSAGTPSPAAPSATPSAPAPSTPAPSTSPGHASPAAPHHKPVQSTAPAAHAPSSQQAFINAVAPGAMAAQQRWGVPASVTISQAIEESAWGQSSLAASYNNLFGIKGSGPAGSVMLPTQEFQNGQWVTVDAPFRAYHTIAQSIDDHAQLLATSGYYTHAMADRHSPDAFANDLTGVYATDPHYGSNLISIMRLYNLYRYDTAGTPHAPAHPAPTHPAAAAHSQSPAPAQPSGTPQPSASAPASSPAPTATPAPSSPQSSPSATPSPSAPSASPSHGYTPVPAPLHAHAAAAIPGQQPFAGAGQAPTAGGAAIPGLNGFRGGGPQARYGAPPASRANTSPTASTASASATASAATTATTMAYVRPAHAAPRPQARPAQRLYEPELPDAVKTAFFASARTPIARAAPMYKDIANQAGISWKLLAACDWMQCQAQPHLSPVHGERLGSLNPDGTVYTTRSAALAQCAADLVELAYAVYLIDLTVPRRMSVRALSDVFAAFRWGGLLRRHRVSSMEFPYSVEGLTQGHQKMRWPAITEPGAPDKPGTRFRMPFGAVPIVLSLDYRATV
jgi:flagellum-specific peptidoglycan hydrolase FlgJ